MEEEELKEEGVLQEEDLEEASKEGDPLEAEVLVEALVPMEAEALVATPGLQPRLPSLGQLSLLSPRV